MNRNLQIGIQFKASTARLASVRQSQNPTLTLTDSLKLPGGIDSAGLFVDPKSVIQILADWVTKNELRGQPAVFSVPNNSAFISWTKLPEVTGQELLSVARYRLRKQFPKMGDHAVVAVAQPSGSNEESLAIGVNRELIDQRADIIDQAGLNPLAAEVEAQAMLRIVDHGVRSSGNFDPHANYCIVQIESLSTNFIVIRSGKLSFMRTVRVGSRAIEEVVNSALSESEKSLEEILYAPTTWLFNRQFLSCLNSTFEPIDIGEPTNALVKEFRLLLNYFRSLYPERSYEGVINHLIVLGKISQLRGFNRAIADLLAIEMDDFNPLVGLALDLSHPTYLQTTKTSTQFTVPLGLAQAPYQVNPSQQVNHESEFRFIRQAI